MSHANMKRQVILVDLEDRPIGQMEKMQAHREGLLHRAFSVFLLNSKQQTLLQQRYKGKYHSPLLWSNACCSHPMPDEETQTAAIRRLHEELNLTANLTEIGVFHYKKSFDNGLIENEIDHVYVGNFFDTVINPNPHEVEAVKWVDVLDLKNQVDSNPQNFSYWLPEALSILMNHLKISS